MTDPSFLFGDFVLDPGRRELRRGGTAVAMGPQVFDLLLFLVRARHRVVSKDDLIDKVWGGRIVSDSTLTSHLNAVRKALGDSGKEQRLVRTVARKGVRFVGEAREAPTQEQDAAGSAPSPAAEAPLALPDKPSIAVLPFQNMSDDPQQNYFAEGMAEDIITALSRFRSLFVIARNSSFTYAGRRVDVRQVGRELGVRYVLEGSVRRAGGTVRFTAQLVDATTGGHVWADKYDGPMENLFELQDRITEAVVGIIEPTIELAEIERTRRKHPENMGAYDHFLRSLAHTNGMTRESITASLESARRAIALDASFAPAYALAARAHIQRYVLGWNVDDPATGAAALEFIEGGLRADRFDPLVLATAGHCFAMFAHDLEKGIAYTDEAIAINPNQAQAYMHSAWVRIRAGDTRNAIERLERARRLSPRDLRSYAFFQSLALAHLIEGDPATALLWARRAVQHNPNYTSAWYALAASAAANSRLAEAREATARLLGIDPGFSITRWGQRSPLGDRGKFEPVMQAMRAAGIPE